MERINSRETNVSGNLESETDVKIEIKEEFCAVTDDVITQEITPNDNQQTTLPGRPEQNTQFHNVIFPPAHDKRLPPRCRLCASQGIDMVDMLHPNESDKNILEKIEKCLPIVVKKTDHLPKQACRLCLANLELCYQFHKTVAEAERQLLAFERLASREFEESERSCGAFQSSNGQDNLEGTLKTVSEVETSDDELKTIPEQVQIEDSPAMNGVVSDGLKTSPELSFPNETLDEGSRTTGSNVNVYQSAEWSRNIPDSWRLPAPQNIQQSNYDSLAPPGTSNMPQVHKDMIPSSFYGMEFAHLRKDNLAFHDPAEIRKGPYSCRVCAKTFKSKTGRDNHVRTHTGEGLHSCEYCDKKFSLKGNRDYHHRIHTGERPFKCSICSKTFAWSGSLYEHATVHSKDRNYHCSVCNKSFKLVRARNRHMLGHAREQTQGAAFVAS